MSGACGPAGRALFRAARHGSSARAGGGGKAGFVMDQLAYDKVLFFGRTASEVQQMFCVGHADLQGRRVLDCPGGPSSFSAVACEQGCNAVAVDPIYAQPHSVALRMEEDLALVTSRMANVPDEDKEAFLGPKKQGYLNFLADFKTDEQRKQRRYVPAMLPNLPFAENEFDLVLSGSLLFMYAPLQYGGIGMAGGAFDLAWHRAALVELLRVASNEVRIFPAHTFNWSPAVRHPYAVHLTEEFVAAGIIASYEFYTSDLPPQGAGGELVGLVLRKTR